jgi:hypothetical protein
VGNADADLKVARVGRLVAEQDDVERTVAGLDLRIAEVSAAAVRCGSQSATSMGSSTHLLTPMLAAYRSCSSASAGPRVSTVDSPPCCSTICTAASTAHSSCGLVVKARYAVSTA